jgi:sugar-specific transcriptional regulator TrmB
LAAEESEIAALRRLGLSENESKLYLALLRIGPTKSSQLSFFSQVPRTKTYSAIKELERKGLVHITHGKPELFAPRSPMEVLMPIVSRLDHDVKDCEQVVQSLAMAYESSKYVKRGTPKQSEELWERKGRQQVREAVDHLIRNASQSIRYSTTAAGLIRTYKAHAEGLEYAVKNGASVRLLCPATSENSAAITQISEIIDLKTVQEPLANFVCVDSKELVVIESKPDDERTDQGSDVAVSTTKQLLVEMFERLFDEVWRNTPAAKQTR